MKAVTEILSLSEQRFKMFEKTDFSFCDPDSLEISHRFNYFIRWYETELALEMDHREWVTNWVIKWGCKNHAPKQLLYDWPITSALFKVVVPTFVIF